jgi:hypothetical protein
LYVAQWFRWEREGDVFETRITAERGDCDEVAEWQERRFKLRYRISRGADLAVEAFEVRAWALSSGEEAAKCAYRCRVQELMT